jgi:hypothetical protein
MPRVVSVHFASFFAGGSQTAESGERKPLIRTHKWPDLEASR